MSIVGTFFGLLFSGVALGVANSKSNKKLRDMQNDAKKYYAKGCDPKTEYIIACETYKKVFEFESKVKAELEEDIKNLSWQDLFKKYPEVVDQENEFRRRFHDLPVDTNETEARKYIEWRFPKEEIQRVVKKEFLSAEDGEKFSDNLFIFFSQASDTFEISIACAVAGRELHKRGFTPLGGASYASGGYNGYNVSRHPPIEFMIKVTCDPSEEDKRSALNAMEHIYIPYRRDGAAELSAIAKEEEEREKNEKFATGCGMVFVCAFLIFLFIIFTLIEGGYL